MNKEKLYNYFSSTFHLYPSTHGWYRYANPFTLSKNITMAVNFDYNIVKCYKTGYKDFCINFVMEYEDIDYREAVDIINDYDEIEYSSVATFIRKENVFKLPEGFHPLYSNGAFSNRAIQYVESRGFDSKLLNNWGFGFCDDGDFKGYLIIPFKIKGQLVYYIGRDFLGRSIKYRNPKTEDLNIGKADIFFNEDALELYDDVELVEGWSDAVTVGKQCVASLGWSLSDVQRSKLIKAKPKTLTIIPDKGFYKKALATAFGLCDFMKVKVLNLDNEEKKDVNELGMDRVNEIREQTKYYSPVDMFL